MLLLRPAVCNRTYHSETVNDADGLLVNAWRGIQLHPAETAEAASWPVAEADLHARHLALVNWRASRNLEALMGDPSWCDPVMAGWWIWGCSCSIGGGWCSGRGPWVIGADGRMEKRRGPGEGINRKIPHVSSDGGGVNRPQARELGVNRHLPNVGDDGRGVNHAGARELGIADEAAEFHQMTMPKVRRWFDFLSARLRHVRILNGDWSRLCTNGALKVLSVRQGNGTCGVFLDPPYADTAGRCSDLYNCDDEQVAHRAAEWALEHGQDPQLRIVLAGFEEEHADLFEAAGWREVEWFAKGYLRGGMGNINANGHQMARERLWFSPHCLQPDALRQLTLFDEE